MRKIYLGRIDSDVVYREKQTTMNIRFHLHSYVNSNGESQILMGISSGGKRVRIPLNLHVKKNEWDRKKQKLRGKTDFAEKINLILEKERSRILDIKLFYHLANRSLTLERLVTEYKNETPSYDFIAFMKGQLDKMPMKESSRKKHLAQISKLQDFRSYIPFGDINIEFINDFRNYLFSVKKNNANTITATLAIIKKFIRKAINYGIPLDIDIDQIKISRIVGNRTYLNTDEINLLKEYYFSKFIKETHSIALGAFLFSCYTGLRLSDVKGLHRSELKGRTFTFVSEKTGKKQTLLLNRTAHEIIDHFPDLFLKWISDQKINEQIKQIASICGIRKNISFHVARHSFATNFLRRGGKVEELQVLLAHSKITTTMVYVHMVRAEQIENIFLLDD